MRCRKCSSVKNPKPGLNYGSWKLGEFSDRQQPEKSLTQRGFGTHGRVTGNITFFFYALPNGKIMDWSKLKAFADDKLNATENSKFGLGWVESIVEKGEKC